MVDICRRMPKNGGAIVEQEIALLETIILKLHVISSGGMGGGE